MAGYRGGRVSPTAPTTSSVAAQGVWQLTDVLQGQKAAAWPFAVLNNYEAAVTALFGSSEPGFWLDPSDVTVMYQDMTGLTPVTAVEQPVGLIYDKAHAPTDFGPERITNGDFSAGSTGWTATAGATISDGKVNCSSASNFLYQDSALVVGKWYRISFDIVVTSGSRLRLSGASAFDGGEQSWSATTGTKTAIIVATGTTLGIEASLATFTGTLDNVSVREFPQYCAYQSNDSRRPVYSRRHNLLTGTASLATQSVTTQAIGYTLSFTGSGSIALSGTGSGTFSAGTNTFTASAGTLTLTVTGEVTNAQLVPTYKASLPYQAVVNSTSYDVDSTKFPAYLRISRASFQNLKSTTITPGTDKMQVFAGVNTFTSTDLPMIVETSASADTNNGSMYLLGPVTSTATRLRVRGTAEVTLFTDAPEVNVGPLVYAATGDIAGSLSVLRKNGTAFSSSSSPGTGNFAAYEASFFSRNGGSTLNYEGECYGIVLRFGPNLTTPQITAVETYMASKCGITL